MNKSTISSRALSILMVFTLVISGLFVGSKEDTQAAAKNQVKTMVLEYNGETLNNKQTITVEVPKGKAAGAEAVINVVFTDKKGTPSHAVNTSLDKKGKKVVSVETALSEENECSITVTTIKEGTAALTVKSKARKGNKALKKIVKIKVTTGPFIDESVGVFRKELTNETATVRYFDDMPSIAYMNIEDYYAVMLPGYSMSAEPIGNGQYKLTNACGTALVDVNTDTFTSANYAAFTNLMWQIQDGMDNIYFDGYPFIQVVGAEYLSAPKEVTFPFGERYGIDLRADGGHVYFPLATLSDMFSNMDYLYSSFNGVNLYVNADNDMDFNFRRDPAYYDPILESRMRDAGLADFNYRELCFAVDYLYGYPGRGILYEDVNLEQVGLDKALEDFGPIGTRTKELVQSTDWIEYFVGMNRMSVLLGDGGHTNMGVSAYIDYATDPDFAWINEKLSSQDTFDKYFSDIVELVTERGDSNMEELYAMLDLRKQILGDGHYFTKGDTALYSMNGFVADKEPWIDYYKNGGNFDDYDETVFMGLVSAMNKAQADPNIHNFVIDLSTNGGGSADVLMALYSLITGDREVTLTYQSVLQGQEIRQNFLVDRNFDGKFDEADADVHYDLNFAVLASKQSYSCGNLFPSMMKDLGYMTLGELSGGGACTILTLNTADGFYYHMSSYEMRLTNAAGEVIDAGVKPDAELVKTDAEGKKDYSDFYNLELLSKLMNSYYAKEVAA